MKLKVKNVLTFLLIGPVFAPLDPLVQGQILRDLYGQEFGQENMNFDFFEKKILLELEKNRQLQTEILEKFRVEKFLTDSENENLEKIKDLINFYTAELEILRINKLNFADRKVLENDGIFPEDQPFFTEKVVDFAQTIVTKDEISLIEAEKKLLKELQKFLEEKRIFLERKIDFEKKVQNKFFKNADEILKLRQKFDQKERTIQEQENHLFQRKLAISEDKKHIKMTKKEIEFSKNLLVQQRLNLSKNRVNSKKFLKNPNFFIGAENWAIGANWAKNGAKKNSENFVFSQNSQKSKNPEKSKVCTSFKLDKKGMSVKNSDLKNRAIVPQFFMQDGHFSQNSAKNDLFLPNFVFSFDNNFSVCPVLKISYNLKGYEKVNFDLANMYKFDVFLADNFYFKIELADKSIIALDLQCGNFGSYFDFRYETFLGIFPENIFSSRELIIANLFENFVLFIKKFELFTQESQNRQDCTAESLQSFTKDFSDQFYHSFSSALYVDCIHDLCHFCSMIVNNFDEILQSEKVNFLLMNDSEKCKFLHICQGENVGTFQSFYFMEIIVKIINDLAFLQLFDCENCIVRQNFANSENACKICHFCPNLMKNVICVCKCCGKYELLDILRSQGSEERKDLGNCSAKSDGISEVASTVSPPSNSSEKTTISPESVRPAKVAEDVKIAHLSISEKPSGEAEKGMEVDERSEAMTEKSTEIVDSSDSSSGQDGSKSGQSGPKNEEKVENEKPYNFSCIYETCKIGKGGKKEWVKNELIFEGLCYRESMDSFEKCFINLEGEIFLDFDRKRDLDFRHFFKQRLAQRDPFFLRNIHEVLRAQAEGVKNIKNLLENIKKLNLPNLQTYDYLSKKLCMNPFAKGDCLQYRWLILFNILLEFFNNCSKNIKPNFTGSRELQEQYVSLLKKTGVVLYKTIRIFLNERFYVCMKNDFAKFKDSKTN